MDLDEVWRTIDEQRTELADLMGTFTAQDWQTPSLCEGWRVREVAAHLTLAQSTFREVLPDAVRARGSFNRMIRDSAIRQAALPVEEYADRLRAMVGSRRTAPFISDLEPLLDVLVHGQDIVRPLGRPRSMPTDAAATAAQRAWSMGFPFRARRRLRGFRLVATDHSWSVGEGTVVEAPVADLLLLVTGRDVVLPDLAGPGAGALRERLGAQVS
jgi:uncharacterized protein (TIGR03083 family)